MTSPGAFSDLTDPRVPNSPFWWLARLSQKLMDRAPTYDLREQYVTGNHPLPNGDRRFVKALRELQRKAKTNYIELVQQAVVQKLRVKGFRFGTEGFADKDAQRIWQYNDMDYQAPVLINDAATFGFSYALVSPPIEPGGEPIIAMRDPRYCEIERDPSRPTKTLAGLEFWASPADDAVLAILYLPDAIYYFSSHGIKAEDLIQEIGLRGMTGSINKFRIVDVRENALGEVPLERCDWQPAFGEDGRSEGEVAFDIQDRINKMVLDRLVISNSQAYRQRWVSGAPSPKSSPGSSASRKPPWEPGADMIWVSEDPDTKFGDFEQADITQLLEATRDDVGDMAAITQTPATYLTNRMVNISGDTIAQAQGGHIAKVKLRQDAVGFFFERLQKIAFKYKGDIEKAQDATAQTLWHSAEVRSFAEVADAMQKWIATGIPLQLAMDKSGQFSPEEIEWAVQEAERIEKEKMAREDQMMDKQLAAKANQANSPGGSSK